MEKLSGLDSQKERSLPMTIPFLRPSLVALNRFVCLPSLLTFPVLFSAFSLGQNTPPQLYFFEEYQQGTWTLEKTFPGDTGRWVSSRVRFSADGNTAVLRVKSELRTRIDWGTTIVSFDADSNTWRPLGQTIRNTDEEGRGQFGMAVTLSADGQTLAAGHPDNSWNSPDSGRVDIFHYDPASERWVPRGAGIYGEFAGDRVGGAVALSADGLTVIIGSQNNDGNGEDSGHARIFRFDQDRNSWIQLGEDIDGEAAGDNAGTVGLSSDGLTAIIGAPHNDDNGADSGHARIFQFDEATSSWIQLGQDIDGEQAGDRAGYVDLSPEGLTATVRGLRRSSNSPVSSFIRAFRFDRDSNSWSQLIQDELGEDSSDWLPYAIQNVKLTSSVSVQDGVKHMKVFRFNQSKNSWAQIGQDIIGIQDQSATFDSVAYSADGLTAIISSIVGPNNGSEYEYSSVVSQIYRLILPDIINYDHPENTRTVMDVKGFDDFDSEGAGLVYLLSGIDASLFSIDPTGKLRFIDTPKFQSPADSDFDNVYEITVTITDSQSASTEQALSITVVDDSPMLSGVSDITLTANQTDHVDFNLSGFDIPLVNLNVSAQSDNQDLIRDSTLVFSGTDSNRSLAIRPVNGLFGSSNITITVSDDFNTVTSTFTVTVVNTAPRFTFTEGFPIGEIWTQLGQDIDGEAYRDHSGTSVDLSADGLTAIVGAPGNNGNGALSGHTRIFRFDLNSHSWSQLGQDIDGKAKYDQSGDSVALSADGLTCIIGASRKDVNGTYSGHARIFRLDQNSNLWLQLGEDIPGDTLGDRFGSSVDLSADGLTAIVGGFGNDGNGDNSGHTRIFRYDENSNSWTQLGQDIDGENHDDRSGYSVALSADGLTAIVGAPYNSGNGENSGRTRIFRFDQGTQSWAQIGQNIDGEASLDLSGFSVDLSTDGLTAIVGAPGNDHNGTSSGHTRIFRFLQDSQLWAQIGQNISGEASLDSSGYSVALSADGLTAIIGARFNDGNGDRSGHARAFRFHKNTQSWAQLGQDIDGEAVYDQSGILALSADGVTAIIGARENDGNGSSSGHVRIFRLLPAVISYDIMENTALVTDVEFSDDIDSEGAGLSYSLSGADAPLFFISPNGILFFRNAPDFEAPADIDSDNIYEVTVTATDSQSASSEQPLTINVTDIDENTIDIALAIEALQMPLVAGGAPLTAFQVTATNRGFLNASNVLLAQTTTFPADTILVSTTPSTGTFANDNWNLDLPIGNSASLKIVVQSGIDAASGPNALPFGFAFASSDQVETPIDNNTATASIPIISGADIDLHSTTHTLDNQTGLFTSTATMTNNGSVTIPAARLFVTNLPLDVQLSNTAGATARGPYILLNSPITIGNSANVEIEFSRDNQDPNFTPIYELELLSWPLIDPITADGRISKTQTRMLKSGEPLIEIVSVPEAIYEIEYTSDMGSTWQKVDPQITATDHRLLWIDSGPPQTDRHPFASTFGVTS